MNEHVQRGVRIVAATVLLGGVMVWLLVGPLPRWIAGVDLDELAAADRPAVLAEIRTQVLLVVSVMVLIIAGYVGISRWLARQSAMQVGRQFADAADRLASPSAVVRAAALRELDRIQHTFPAEHDRVTDLVCRFLRVQSHEAEHETRAATPPPVDVEAALDLLSRGVALGAAQIAIPGLGLRDFRSHRRVALPGADLVKATMSKADLSGADLSGTDLTGAHLVGVRLAGANLSRANLTNADLTSANLTDTNLTGATLKGAKLTDVWMPGARLTDADLQATVLVGVNLSDTQGLTEQQLRGAGVDPERWPPDLVAKPRP